MTEPLLTVQDLRVEFTLRRKTLLGPKPILKAVDGVSFTVNKGETLAIVGESGSGKTTAALAIARLVNTAGGTVHLEGQELLALEGQDLLKMREKVQFIFQDPYSSLNPRKRAEDLVREPLDSLTDKTTDEKQTIIDDLFAAVGLRKEQQRLFPHQFSGGQRQRIGIARALATQPRVIICDEPVSALDVAVQAQILNLLRRLQTDFGLTYLFISHDLGVVQYVSDKIAVMYMGKIVELADRLSLPFSNNNGRDDKKIVIWAYRKWVLFLNMNRLHLPPKGMINDSFRSNFPWHFNAWGQFDPACLCVVEQHAIVVTRCEMAADFPRNPSDRGTGWLYGCCYFAVAWIADMALGRRLDWFRRIFKHARGALFLGASEAGRHQEIACARSRGLCRIKLNPLVHFFRQAQAVGNRKASYYIRQIFGLSGQCLAGRGCFFEHAGVLLCRDIQLFYRRVDFTDPSRLVVGRGRNQGHVLRLRRVCHRGSCQADAGFINQRDALINVNRRARDELANFKSRFRASVWPARAPPMQQPQSRVRLPLRAQLRFLRSAQADWSEKKPSRLHQQFLKTLQAFAQALRQPFPALRHVPDVPHLRQRGFLLLGRLLLLPFVASACSQVKVIFDQGGQSLVDVGYRLVPALNQIKIRLVGSARISKSARFSVGRSEIATCRRPITSVVSAAARSNADPSEAINTSASTSRVCPATATTCALWPSSGRRLSDSRTISAAMERNTNHPTTIAAVVIKARAPKISASRTITEPSILEAIELMRMTFGGVNNTLEQLLKLVRRSEKRAKKAPKFAKAA
ncbi:Oligopeptide transport ATP-binding protein OppF [Nymphon striatum]|nr:Oligopeptide transport ATP-binding protein OppF [Nymphon striatum]